MTPSDNDIKHAIVLKTRELLHSSTAARFADKLRPPMPHVDIKFIDAKTRQMGRASMDGSGNLSITFNMGYVRQDPELFLRDTVPHEVAHIICFHNGLDRGHGKMWKRVAAALGCNPRALCAASTIQSLSTTRQRKKYCYNVEGREVWVTDVKHSQIQQGTKQWRLATAFSSAIIHRDQFTGKHKV